MAREIEKHFGRLVELGCVVCMAPAIVHHCHGGSMRDVGVHKGWGQKVSDWLTIPLCPRHHNGDEGVHTVGVLTWEERYGCQVDFLREVSLALGYDVFERAAA